MAILGMPKGLTIIEVAKQWEKNYFNKKLGNTQSP
jgi:hypothetical protein